jgi:hypothetical protein
MAPMKTLAKELFLQLDCTFWSILALMKVPKPFAESFSFCAKRILALRDALPCSIAVKHFCSMRDALPWNFSGTMDDL